MEKLTLTAVVLVLVLEYTQARPYYYGYQAPWYPVSPCTPYPPPPCSPYPYPCGAQQPSYPPRPTPCNPQPAGPPNKPPPATYNQQTAEEALLTQDISVRPVRQGTGGPPWPPRQQRPHPLRKYLRYPEYNTNDYRALKRKPYRRNRWGSRRNDDEGEHYGGYGPGMAPAGYRDDPEDVDDYDEGAEYPEYDHGMGQGVRRDAGDYGSDEEDDEDDY